MLRSSTILGMLFVFGCTQAEAPPKMPEPVTITVPADGTPTSTGPSAGEVAALEGDWSHSLPAENGAERRVVLKYIKDQDGPERFEIVQHDWPDKPVFAEKIANGKDTDLRFKMVSAANEPQETEKTLRYLIHPENGQWVGTLTESWTKTSYPVTLTKSK